MIKIFITHIENAMMKSRSAMMKSRGGYRKFRKREPKLFSATTQLLPLHMNVQNIMGDDLGKLDTLKIEKQTDLSE